MSELKGVCVPACTPFDKTGDNVDEKALSAHIERLDQGEWVSPWVRVGRVHFS